MADIFIPAAILGFTALSIGKLISGFDNGRTAGDGLLYSGRCRAPLWSLMQNLDTLVNVRKPSAHYPLNRFWLELQDSDYHRGNMSASLEFVEKVVRDRLLGI
ncbi:MAG: hypothetical protein K2X27_19045, partial [Candidatus Obscuribacterales bacterium]|nr:hypothetical protein [Candidatus Obscuribacterales bacterium]